MCPYAIELHVTGKLQKEEKNKKLCTQKGIWGAQESEVKNAHPSWWVLCYKEEQQTSLPCQQTGFTKSSARKWGSGLLSASGVPRRGWAPLRAAQQWKSDVETAETVPVKGNRSGDPFAELVAMF